jgi:SAM-dependent methyltransferase
MLEKRAESFIRMFEGEIKPDSMILDIGSGPGVYFQPLKDKGHWVSLMDTNRYKSCPHFMTYFDGKTFPFMDKSFNLSLLITVLHHTPDPEATLREAKRVSRDLVIVIEDVYESLPGRILTIARDAALNFEFVGHPLNFKSYSEWKRIFERLGFSLLREKDFTSYLGKLPIRTGLYILKP